MKDLENAIIGDTNTGDIPGTTYTSGYLHVIQPYDREMKIAALNAAVQVTTSPRVDANVPHAKKGDNQLLLIAEDIYQWLIKPDQVNL